MGTARALGCLLAALLLPSSCLWCRGRLCGLSSLLAATFSLSRRRFVFLGRRNLLRGRTAARVVVVVVVVADGVALLDLVLGAFLNLDDADVNARLAVDVGDVLAALVDLGVPGDVPAAWSVVLELVADVEVLRRELDELRRALTR